MKCAFQHSNVRYFLNTIVWKPIKYTFGTVNLEVTEWVIVLVVQRIGDWNILEQRMFCVTKWNGRWCLKEL